MVAIFVLTLFLLFISVDLIVLKIQGKSHPAFEPSIHLNLIHQYLIEIVFPFHQTYFFQKDIPGLRRIMMD